SIQFGLTDQFITPLALFLGANKVTIGMLSFIRNALASIVQINSAELTHWFGSRKKFLTTSVLIAALLWLPTYFLPFFFDKLRMPVFIVFFALTSCFNLIATPAWASLVAEHIPFRKRGQYFGFRAAVLGVVYFISLLLAGLLLHAFERFDLFLGFAILIILASVSRLLSWGSLAQMYEPKWRPRTEYSFTFWAFVRRLPVSNFARYAVFSAFFMMSVALVSPFFAVYILSELGFSYFPYAVLTAGTILTTFVTQRYWGWFADRYGNLRIIGLTTALISIVPLLWLFSKSFFYLLVIQLLAGFLWAGFNLSSVNFIYDVAVSGKRERCIAYFNFLSGAGLGIGALAGGFLYRHLPPIGGSSFFSLLVISACARFIFAQLISLFTKEVRQVHPIRPQMLLLDITGVRALGLMSKELLVTIRRGLE
ncbi:MAG: MFS transporter, partial [Candidatus Margulisiibacteriota bacterium]